MGALVVGILIALFGELSLAADRKHEPRLLISPRICIAMPGQGCVVTATVLIEDPREKWYCPKVEFRWAEGFTSSVEGDCPPYDELDEDERGWFRLTRRFRYGPGETTVAVMVTQGKARILLKNTVDVR